MSTLKFIVLRTVGFLEQSRLQIVFHSNIDVCIQGGIAKHYCAHNLLTYHISNRLSFHRFTMRTPAQASTSMATMATSSATTMQMLRQLMAQAAESASSVAGDLTPSTPLEQFEPNFRRSSGSTPQRYARRHINQLPPAGDVAHKGVPLPPVEDGLRMKRIQEVANEIKQTYKHPIGASQVETEVLHHVRAILYMNRTIITQSFVSHVAGVSQGSLSHYVRGLFKGNQENVDQRLTRFVELFASGALDPYIDDIRGSVRSASRPLVLPSTTTAPTTVPPIPTSGSFPTSSLPVEKPSVPLPIPPPPPPQLQPAPWAHTPTPDDSSTPDQVTPVGPSAQTDAPLFSPKIATNTDSARGTDGSNDDVDNVSRRLYLPPTQTGPSQPVSDPSNQNERLDPPSIPFVFDGIPERATRPRRRKRTAPVPFVIKPTPPKPQPLMFPDPPEEPKKIDPTTAVDLAFRTLIASDWATDVPSAHGARALLLLIEIYVELDKRVLHTYTQWDVNERQLSAETAADRIRLRLGFPPAFAQPVAMQIRRALFHAGIFCAPPPASQPTENRRLIRFSVQVGEGEHMREIQDECEWDLAAGGLNSPELFAQQLCIDEKVPQQYAVNVAEAIREKLVIAHAISYGDDETRRLASAMIAKNDPLLWQLRTVQSALTKSLPEEERAKEREENAASISKLILIPILDAVPLESEKRIRLQKQRERENRLEEEARIYLQKIESQYALREIQMEKDMKDAEEAAARIYEERNLDFRPYLKLKVARDESPSIWMVPAFDRRRRKQLTFPMVSHRSVGKHQSSRPTKRRKSGRQVERSPLEGKRVRRSLENRESSDFLDDNALHVERNLSDADPKTPDLEKKYVIPLRLSLKRTMGEDSGADSNCPKKRRR